MTSRRSSHGLAARIRPGSFIVSLLRFTPSLANLKGKRRSFICIPFPQWVTGLVAGIPAFHFAPSNRAGSFRLPQTTCGSLARGCTRLGREPLNHCVSAPFYAQLGEPEHASLPGPYFFRVFACW